jgi:hypothetical protein
MPLVDYKAKYLDLKTKFQETVDLAWRLGFEQGAQQAQLDQVAQQQAQADQMAMAANGQPQPGQPGEEGEQPGGQPGQERDNGQPQSQNPNGNELDSHIARLESMLGKGELTSTDLSDLKKTLNDIRSLQVQINLTKSMESIKNTKMAPLKKSISFSPRVQANLPEPAKKALSLQENIVKDVFAKWEKDEQQAASQIGSILNVDGIVKKG